MNFSLGQAWVSRVTEANTADIPVVGADLSPLPDAAQLQTVLRKLALSESAREIVRRQWVQPGSSNDNVAERGQALFDFLFTRTGAAPHLQCLRAADLARNAT